MLESTEPIGGQFDLDGKTYRLEVWVYSGLIGRIIKRSFAKDELDQATQAIEKIELSNLPEANKLKLQSMWMEKALLASHFRIGNIAAALSDPDCLAQVICEASPDIPDLNVANEIVNKAHLFRLPNMVMAAMGINTLKNSQAPEKSGGDTKTSQTTTQTESDEQHSQPAKT